MASNVSHAGMVCPFGSAALMKVTGKGGEKRGEMKVALEKISPWSQKALIMA